MTDTRSKWIALALALTMATATTSVFATDVKGVNTALGSISGAGSVQVRGIAVQQESTLFANDRVRTGPGAYAKLALTNGARVELAGDSELIVKTDDQGLRLNLIAGAATVKASKKPVIVVVSGQEVRPAADATVRVAVLPNELADVRVVSGRAELVNTANKQTTVINEREQRIVNLKTGKIEGALTQVASTLPAGAPPSGIPAPAPPQKKRAGAAVMLGTAGGAAAAITVLTTNDQNANADIRIQKQQAQQTLITLIQVSAAGSATADKVINVAALIASSSPSNAAAANAIKNAATATAAQLATIGQQIAQAEKDLNAAQTQTQLNVVLNTITNLQNQLHQQIDNLNTEVDQINAISLKVDTPLINPVDNVPGSASPSLP